MTIIAFRTAQTARKPQTSALSAGTVLAVAGAVLVGLAVAAIGPIAHHDWQAKLGHYAALPTKPTASAAAHPAPSVSGFGF